MKRKTIVKLILLAFLILMLGIWKSTPCLAVYSWDTDIENKINILNRGGKINITSEVLKNSDYIFCREKGAILQESNFSMDPDVKPNPKTYPIIKYKNQDGKDCGFEDATSVTVLGADIAYALGTYEKGSKTGDGYVDNQWVYWALLNEYKNNGEMQAEIPAANNVEYANLSYTAQKLYHESKAYQQYVQNVEEFKIKYKQKDYSPVIIPKENANISYEINNDGETIAKVGPIIIDYARVWKSYELNKDSDELNKETNHIAFGTITLQFEKTNGEKLKGIDLGIEKEQDNTDAITFQFKQGEKIETENAKIEKLRNNDQIQEGNIYTDTSEIATNNELYINFNLNKFVTKGISELNLHVSTEMGQKKVKIYYLKGNDVVLTNIGKPYYCLNCEAIEDKVIVGRRITKYYSVQNNILEYYNIDTGEQTGKKIAPIKEENIYYECSRCGTLIPDYNSMSLHIRYDHKAKREEAKSSTVTKTEYKYVQKTYRNNKRVWCGNSGN